MDQTNSKYIDLIEEKISKAGAHRGARYVLLALLVLSCFIPIILFYANSKTFVINYSESIAYMYFYAYRMVNGEINPQLWLPHSFLTASIQKVIVFIESLVISPQSHLRLTLELFGYLTFIAHSLIAALLIFLVMRDGKLEKIQKALVVLSLFIPIYGVYFYYYSFYVIPAYYSLDIILSAAFAYLFYFFAMRNNQQISLRMIAGIAFLSGVFVSNKISIIFLAAALGVLLVVRFARQPSFLLRASLISIPFFLLGMLLPWAISQSPNYGIWNINEYLKLWLGFVQNAPQEDGGHLVSFITRVARENPQYIRFVIVYVLVLVFFLIYNLRHYTFRSEQFLITGGLVILAILQLFVSLGTRAAGTTLFESFAILTSFTMMIVGFIPTEERWLVWTKSVFIATCFGLMATNILSDFPAFVRDKGIQESNLVWELHDDALSYRRPIIVVLPDNSYAFGSVEEILLKGFADFPTWNITSGKRLMLEFVPHISYRSDYIEQKPEMPYPTGVVIMWFDIISPERNTNLREAYPELQKVLATDGTKCHQWFFKAGRMIYVCNVP